MAPTPARSLAVLALASGLLAGCSDAPAPRTEVAEGSMTAPSSSEASPSAPAPTAAPSSIDVPATPTTPDLSGNTIDCSTVDGPCEPGDDPELDRLWGACAEGEGRACDRLYYDSAFDSRYEQFGNTCGDRDVLVPCPRRLT